MMAVLVQQQVQAQAQLAVPVASFALNRALAGVITRTAITRGFAANDPIILSTLTGIGRATTAANVASTVAGVGLAVAGAPVWLSVAAGLGILALGVTLAMGTQTMTLQQTSSGNQLVFSGTQAFAPPYTPVSGTEVFSPFTTFGVDIFRSTEFCYPSQACYAFPERPSAIPIRIDLGYFGNEPDKNGTISMAYWDLQQFTTKWIPGAGLIPGRQWSDGRGSTANGKANLFVSTWLRPPSWEFSGTNNKRLIGAYLIHQVYTNPYGDGSPGITFPDVVVEWSSDPTASQGGFYLDQDFGPNGYKDVDTMVANMPESLRTSPVSNSTLAKIANAAWQKAAQMPDYTGLPYSTTQPITNADVATWRASAPAADIPNVGDIAAPANEPGQAVVISLTVQPQSQPATGNNVNVVNTPNVNIVNTVKVDFGADPGTASPSLESTPGAGEVLGPLTSLMPELRSFHVPIHTGECPKPTFDVFNKSLVMDSHCIIAEQHRSALAAVMAVVWLLASLRIILSA
jgi:hypothetical protein